MKSLRSQLTVFWACLAAVCAAFLLLMAASVRNSVDAQAAGLRTTTRGACLDIAGRYEKSLPEGAGDEPRLDILQAVVQLALLEKPQVEGGVWQRSRGLLLYAFPTYQGADVRTSVAPAGEPAVLKTIAEAVRSRTSQTEVVRTGGQAMVVAACPLGPERAGLAAWALGHTREDVPMLRDATLRTAVGIALAALAAAGVWLGLVLVRSHRQVEHLQHRLEAAERELARRNGDSAPTTSQQKSDR